MCGVCDLQVVPQFTLRGDMQGLDLDRNYFWQEEMADGKYWFRGWRTTRVWWNTGRWNLGPFRTQQKILTLGGKVYPFGRQHWWNPQQNTSQELSFDQCNATEFNCDDGTCVDLRSRCDVALYCQDESDEDACVRVVAKSANRRDRPPLPTEQ